MPIVKRYTFQPRVSAGIASQFNTNFDDIIDAFNNHRHSGVGTDAPNITISGIQDSMLVGLKNKYMFSAYRSAAVNSSSSATKVSFDTELYDYNNNFSGGTYTVPITGCYQFNAMVGNTVAASTLILTILYKNGAEANRGNGIDSTLNGGLSSSHVSSLISCTAGDTIEVYFVGGGGSVIAVGKANCYFNGFLAGAV